MKKHLTEAEISKAKSVDIIQFLERNGVSVEEKGRTSVCSSPFSSDSTPSFVIYTDQNLFHDFSTGKRGDTINLAQFMLNIEFQEAVELLNENIMPVWDEKKFEIRKVKKKPFSIDRYTTGYESEIRAIDAYAKLRGLTRNYLHGFFAKKVGDWLTGTYGERWHRFPSIMFPHTDINGKITGAKFRNVFELGERFSARGKLGYYICDNLYWADFDTYIVEGEANANSLCEYFGDIEENARVISFGGVGQIPKELPKSSGKTYIIIDYDGDDKLYNERLKAYDHLNGTPIKMILPKYEDINSLWARGDVETLKEMLNN